MKILHCLSCGKELKGRSDKKFCDSYCKSNYHYKNRSSHEMNIQKTNSILRKNRSILSHYCPAGKNTIRKEFLVESGFQFNYFTSIFPYKNGTYYFCYDYGYLPILDKGNEKVVIVQKQLYMEDYKKSIWDYKITY